MSKNKYIMSREKAYLEDYKRMNDVYKSLKEYFIFYNLERPHQSLNYTVPKVLYPNNKIYLRV